MKRIYNCIVKGVVMSVVSALGAMWVVGVMLMLNSFVEWTCADGLRFVVVATAGATLVLIQVYKELSK